ncbi:MAG: hypothetical protein CMA31_01270 [Euryarchaeota archaeon]|nr:hypothetical protein [Euryarchaeota archaeon]|tara:strand:+ start:1812 stop:2477 length:666 start_codon:yes stop_codon:yes gene_type:complete
MDLNFYNTIQELNKNEVSYWVCHGSLLGLARDGDLIPWDHDIDIAVWEGEYTEEYIINVFKLMGFKWNQDHPDGSLNFQRNGARSVDVNFYKDCESSTKLACCLHRLPKSKIFSMLDKLAHNKKYEGKYVLIYRFFKLFKFIFVPLHKLLDKAGVLYLERGYTTPKDLLVDFINFDYFGVNCKVPEKFKSINAYIYGDDWLVPKKKYNWMTDSSSVMDKVS